jgi:hypothetical protein
MSTMTTRGAASGDPMEGLSATERLKALLPNAFSHIPAAILQTTEI